MATESEASKPANPWHPVSTDGQQDATDVSADNAAGAGTGAPVPAKSTPTEGDEQPRSISDSHELTPAKPPRPSAAPRDNVPTPIEADAAELVPAVTLPDAAETFPTAVVTTEIEVSPPEPRQASDKPASTSPYLAPHTRDAQVDPDDPGAAPNATPAAVPTTEPAPVTGSVRGRPASAAALLSVGDLTSFDDDAPAFVPRYEPAHMPDQPTEQSPLANTTLEDSHEPAYFPPVSAPRAEAGETPGIDHQSPTESLPEDTMTDATPAAAAPTDQPAAAAAPGAGADAGQGGVPPSPEVTADHNADASGSIWTSTAFLVVLGILAMAGIGFGVYALFFKPVDVVLPAQTVLTAPTEPTVTPVTPTDPSDFLAAMPTTVGTYVLTDYTSLRADDPASIPEGTSLGDTVAEQVTLTYSDGTDEVVVNAWQHYDIGGAQQTFEALNVDGTDSQPVIVDGQEVGVQVDVLAEAGPSVLWSNGTAVFSAASGGADGLGAFVEGFGF